MNLSMRVYFHTYFPPSVAFRHTDIKCESTTHIVIGMKHGHAYNLGFAKNQLDGYRIRRAVLDHGSDHDEIIVSKIHPPKTSEIQKGR